MLLWFLGIARHQFEFAFWREACPSDIKSHTTQSAVRELFELGASGCEIQILYCGSPALKTYLSLRQLLRAPLPLKNEPTSRWREAADRGCFTLHPTPSRTTPTLPGHTTTRSADRSHGHNAWMGWRCLFSWQCKTELKSDPTGPTVNNDNKACNHLRHQRATREISYKVKYVCGWLAPASTRSIH
jgi:hypothetical protein